MLIWKSLTITWNNLLKHCIYPKFLLIEGEVQGTLRKAFLIATFVERFKKNVISAWKNLPKHCIFSDISRIVSYVQGALQKELLIAPFAEHFRTTTFGKSH